MLLASVELFTFSKHLDQASSQWKIDSRQDGERFSTIENQFVWGKESNMTI